MTEFLRVYFDPADIGLEAERVSGSATETTASCRGGGGS